MKKVFMFVNIDWFFLSHRLPVAQAAQKNNIDMTVYTEFTQPHNKSLLDGFNLLNSPMRRRSKSVLHLILEFTKVYKIIRKGKPNLIHAVTIKPILVMGVIARLTSTPFIGSISGLGPVFIVDNFLAKLRLLIVLRILRLVFQRKDASVICQNYHDRDVLVTHGLCPIEKIILINGSGVDLENYSPAKKRANSEKYILMSSRMLFDKGIKEYCLAAEIVRRHLSDQIIFKLSGPIDSSSPTSISKYELNNLVNKYGVEYLGNRKDMPELLASAIMFVLPSYYPEGLPKVLLEAAASGIPIITTDHPGCRDAIQDRETGLLVNVKDHEAVASGIIELLTNHSLKKHMCERARLLAETSFDDKSVVDDHYSLYSRLL